MGFLDKAKAAATDLAAKADTALSQASTSLSGGGDAERLLRDYGLLSWRQSHGQPIDDAELTRVTEALQRQDAEGRLQGLALHTTPVAAPPPPGGYQAPPPPGGSATPPPPGGQQAPPPPGGSATPPPPGGQQAPPPPGQYDGPAGQPGPATPEGGQSAPGTEGGQPGSGPESGGRVPPPPPPPSGF